MAIAQIMKAAARSGRSGGITDILSPMANARPDLCLHRGPGVDPREKINTLDARSKLIA
jgi:hypothetical protein